MMVVAGLVVGGAIKLFWPEHYFAWFPFIPLYFISSDGIIFYVRLLSEVYAA